MSLERAKRLLALARSSKHRGEAKSAADQGVRIVLESEHRFWPEPLVLRDLLRAYQIPGLDRARREEAALNIAKFSASSELVSNEVYQAEVQRLAEQHLGKGRFSRQAQSIARSSYDFLRVVLAGTETHDGKRIAERTDQLRSHTKRLEEELQKFRQEFLAPLPRSTKPASSKKKRRPPHSTA